MMMMMMMMMIIIIIIIIHNPFDCDSYHRFSITGTDKLIRY
jgi:hypothetical protein